MKYIENSTKLISFLGFSSQQKPVEEAGPPGPPQFALDDDEAIQKFRDSLSSRFAPQSSTRDRTRGSTGYVRDLNIHILCFAKNMFCDTLR